MLTRMDELEVILKSRNDQINMEVYKQDVKGYERWIICCDMQSTEILKEKWKDIVDDVAIDVQPNIAEMISKMNIYVLFFVKDINDILLKTSIENDKYSSRKIVITRRMSSVEDMAMFVEKRLFDININVNGQSNEKRLYEVFSDLDNELFEIFNSGIKNYERVLNEYIKS